MKKCRLDKLGATVEGKWEGREGELGGGIGGVGGWIVIWDEEQRPMVESRGKPTGPNPPLYPPPPLHPPTYSALTGIWGLRAKLRPIHRVIRRLRLRFWRTESEFSNGKFAWQGNGKLHCYWVIEPNRSEVPASKVSRFFFKNRLVSVLWKKSVCIHSSLWHAWNCRLTQLNIVDFRDCIG